MIVEPTIAIVGGVAFLLHVVGKWQSTTDTFVLWITSKDIAIYLVTSLLWSVLAVLLEPELSSALGMQPLTYAAIMCYGGGHAVARYLEVKEAVQEKKAAR